MSATKPPKLTRQEERELQERHSATLILLRISHPAERLTLLANVVWPSEALVQAQRDGRRRRNSF